MYLCNKYTKQKTAWGNKKGTAMQSQISAIIEIDR